MSDKKQSVPPTVITLTLPSPTDGGIPLDEASATLLIQRGELAHIREFTYVVMDDLTTAMREAYIAIAEIEANPPVVPEPPQTTSKVALMGKTKAVPEKPQPSEPTIDVPLKKGSIEVKISHLKIVGGETDAAAYRQAVLIAGKLIDGKLWDGQSPVRIDDVYAVQRKLKHLSEEELSLFTLADFVQVGTVTDNDLDAAAEDVVDRQDDEDIAEATVSNQTSDGKSRRSHKQQSDNTPAQPSLI